MNPPDLIRSETLIFRGNYTLVSTSNVKYRNSPISVARPTVESNPT